MLRLIRKTHPTVSVICLYGMTGHSDNYMNSVYKPAIKSFPDKNLSPLRALPATAGGGTRSNQARSYKFTPKNLRSISLLYKSIEEKIMKKISTLCLSVLMLFSFASCGASGSNKQNKDDFIVGYQDLYLADDEIYYLKQMLEYKLGPESADRIDVSLSSDIATYENGIVVPKKTGTCTLSLKQGELEQKISLNIVVSDQYDMSKMSIDVGRLYNKKILFFGDSITHNWMKYPNGDNTVVNDTDSLGYPSHYIVQMNNFCRFANVENCAWSGGTMATPPKNSKTRQIYKCFSYCAEHNETAIKNADYVFIWYGTNDYHEFYEIGSTEDVIDSCEKESTFTGGMKYGLSKILEYNPNAKIIVSNLLARSCNTENGAVKEKDQIAYNDAIAAVASMYKVRLLDMFSLFTIREMRAKGLSQDTGIFYTDDGLHPNDHGYTVITKFILNDGVATEELKKLPTISSEKQ